MWRLKPTRGKVPAQAKNVPAEPGAKILPAQAGANKIAARAGAKIVPAQAGANKIAAQPAAKKLPAKAGAKKTAAQTGQETPAPAKKEKIGTKKPAATKTAKNPTKKKKTVKFSVLTDKKTDKKPKPPEVVEILDTESPTDPPVDEMEYLKDIHKLTLMEDDNTELEDMELGSFGKLEEAEKLPAEKED
jgi:hypothetical protein